MKNFIERSRGLIENRGLLGFTKFVMSSLIRKSQDIVFEKMLTDLDAAYHANIAECYEVQVIDKSNVNSEEVSWLLAQALASENSIYRDGLNQNDILVAITLNKQLVHTSFVQYKTSYKKTLNELGDDPLIGNCWTAEKCRGQKLYPYAILLCCKIIAGRGGKRVLISCDPSNKASIAGINKAGFTAIRNVSTYLILTKLLVQKLTENGQLKTRVGVL